MSEHRRNEYASFGTSFNLPTGGNSNNFNMGKFNNDNANFPDKNKNEFLSKGKRHRESDEVGNSFLSRESLNKMAPSRDRSMSGFSCTSGRDTQKKKELVRKIVENLSNIEESVRDNSSLKGCAENLRNFSIEDFGKFFQVMANIQYICSQDSDSFMGKNKEFITVNEKMLNYNPDQIEEDFTLENIKDINKLIIRKEVPLKTLLKDKLNMNHEMELNPINKMDNSNNIQAADQLISFKSFFEDLLKTVKKENKIENIQIKNLIKIYSNFIYNNGIISFTNVDKLLLDFIIENSLIQNNIQDFYTLCKFWLYEDYLNFEKNVDKFEFLDESSGMSNFNQLKRRYDSILTEVLRRIETHGDLLEMASWVSFIEELPRINEKVVDNLVTTHDKIMVTSFEKIKKESFEKKSLIDGLPHLKLMKSIYLRLRRPSNSSEKILVKFLDLTKSSDSYVIAQAIMFIKSQISSLSKYEADKTKEYAVSQFRELVRINETTLSYESAIISKYPLYFSLMQIDEDLLLELPVVYSNSHEVVRHAMNKNLGLILRNLDTFRAEKLIQKCSENCLTLVLFLIEGKLFRAENMLHRNLNENKLLRRIKSFYNDTNYVEILNSLCDKIPLKDFFKTEENFVWEKVKQFESRKNEENNLRIFSQINNSKNEALYKEEFASFQFEENAKSVFSSFSDKLALYILYFILNVNDNIADTVDNSASMNLVNKGLTGSGDLLLMLKYYRKIGSEKYAENITGIVNKMIAYKKTNQLLFLKLVEILIENSAKESQNGKNANSSNNSLDNKSVKSDNQTISNEANMLMETILSNIYNLKFFILDKLREYLNSIVAVKEPSEIFINEFITFISKLSGGHKEALLKTLDERLKNAIRTKDFILFSDI